MQINGAAQVHGAQQINSPHRLQGPQPSAPTQKATGADQLDISYEASLVSKIRDLPEIRTDKVAEIRAQIESGKYETDEKLDIALDRLLEEIGG